MTPKKYLRLKNFPPKNTTGSSVGLRPESPPWEYNVWKKLSTLFWQR